MRKEWARVFASSPLLAERVRILREALADMLNPIYQSAGRVDGLRQANARAALEATKEEL